MGYSIYLLDGDHFTIKKARQNEARIALMALRREDFSSLHEAMEFEDLEIGCNAAGDVIRIIDWDGEKLLDDGLPKTMQAIAPFVEPGSWIAFIGEDFEAWRYYFDGKTVVEQEGVMTWRE